MGRVGPLLDVPCTQVKAHVCRQDHAYAGLFQRTQSLKNKAVYARTELRMRESKLRTQA